MPKYKYLTGEPRVEIVYTFRLTPEESDKLDAYCKAMGVKKTLLLRQMINSLEIESDMKAS